MKKLLYFGCIRDKGHYLWEREGSYTTNYERTGIPGINPSLLKHIDGIFCPGNTREQGRCNECIVPPVRIISWWDYTIDPRPGSNSNLIGYGYQTAEQMFEDARKLFPSVMARQEILTIPTPAGR